MRVQGYLAHKGNLAQGYLAHTRGTWLIPRSCVHGYLAHKKHANQVRLGVDTPDKRIAFITGSGFMSAGHPQPQTPRPKPSTPNHYTPNPKALTVNHEPLILNSKP